MKNKLMDRRAFLRKTSFLLSGLGFGSTLQFEAHGDLFKKLFSRAEAAQLPSRPNYSLEILAPGGFPLTDMFPSPGMKRVDTGKYFNFYGDHREFLQNGNLWYSWAARDIGKYAPYIAVSEGVREVNVHIPVPATRMGGVVMLPGQVVPSRAPASPSILFAHKTPSNTVLPGINFSPDLDIHSLNGMQNFPFLRNRLNYLELFRQPALSFSVSEILQITDAVRNLNEKLGQEMSKRLSKVEDAKLSSKQGAFFLTTDFRGAAAQDLNWVDGQRRLRYAVPKADPGDRFNVDPELGEMLKLTFVGFKNALFKSSMIFLSSGDWHSRVRLEYGNLQTRLMEYFVANMVDFLDLLSETPDPNGLPGETLFDNTIISLNSEFGRNARTFWGHDNSHGGKAFFVFIGKRVKGGTYGDVQLHPDALPNNNLDRILGFDYETGATIEKTVEPVDVYATHCSLLGIPSTVLAEQGVTARRISAICRDPAA